MPCRREGSGFKVSCPWHEESTPSCAVWTAREGTIVAYCHGCGKSGDALSLIAAVNRLDTKGDFPDVLRLAAEIGGRWDLVDATPSNVPHVHAKRPDRDMTPPREYPPETEVSEVWNSAFPATDDVDARMMLEHRSLDVEAITDRDLARVLPMSVQLPRWARYQGRTWVETDHRLILPAYDAHGRMKSLRAWRVANGETPKRLPPAGYRASGLVLADPFAVGLLRAQFPHAAVQAPLRVVIAEGEPDFLTWATRFSDADETAPLVIGVGGGSWSDAFARRVPSGSRVIIRTDHDRAGDRYAECVRASLAGRCAVRRSLSRG